MGKSIKSNISYNRKYQWLTLAPIILMIIVIPLIVRLKFISLSEEYLRYWIVNPVQDFYSYYKACGIIILSGIMLIITFMALKKKDIKLNSITKIIYLMLAVFIGFTILSTFTSQYKDIATWGAFDRREGLIIQLSYILILIYVVHFILDERDFNIVRYTFLILSIAIGIFGLLQIFGMDPFNNLVFQKLIIPSQYHESFFKNGSIELQNAGMISITLYNSNYVGSFVAVALPILLSGVFIKTPKWDKILSIGATILLMYVLIESKSQAGLVGVILSIGLLIIIGFRKIIQYKKVALIVLGGLTAILLMVNFITNGVLIYNTIDLVEEAVRVLVPSDTDFDPTYGLPIYDIKTKGKQALIYTDKGNVLLEYDSDFNITFKNNEGKPINYETDSKGNLKLEEPYNNIRLVWADKFSGPEDTKVAGVFSEEIGYYILELSQSEGVFVIDTQGYRYETMVAPHLGFEGNEKTGSGRGYIWSRTLPMLKDTLILGHGPDTFALCFPQNDSAAKTYALGNPNIIVDKPHNLYLQYGINSGVIATIALMIAWGLYIIDSIKLYIGKKKYSKGEIYGIACVVSVVGYLGAGFFNDSVVSVAPLFWIILGCGIALNYINKKTNEE